MKKILFGGMVSIGLLLAGQALASAYAPGTQMMDASGQTGTMTIQTQATTQDPSQMKMFIQGLQQGTLTPAQQMDFYNMTQGQMIQTAMPATMGYRMFQSSAQAPFSGSRQAAWFGLMFVLTVALVWVTLLLLIAFLWHHVTKHKHHHHPHP